MIKFIFRFLTGVAVLVAIGVGLLILRNDQMDRGVLALKEGNGVIALDRLKPLAWLGDKTAQMLVSLIYAYGWGGIPKSDVTAIYWFHRLGSFGLVAVEKGTDPTALHELAVAKTYAYGTEGVELDSAESLKWLKLSAESGSKEAANMLTQLSHQ